MTKELLDLKVENDITIRELKLWLAQKEVVEYTNWKSKEENSKDRSAQEKVVAKLKLEDEDWMNKEVELNEAEVNAIKINTIFDTIKRYELGLGNINSGITLEFIQNLEKELLGE